MDFSGDSSGMLLRDAVCALIHGNHIFGAFTLPSSPFLPLSPTDEVYRIAGGALPAPGERIRHLLRRISATRIPVASPLEAQCTYLIRLRETLVLPPEVHAAFSSQADFFTISLLGDGASFANKIPRGYLGELWALIVPHAGPQFLAPDTHLGSLAFFMGARELPLGEMLAAHHASPMFLDRAGNAVIPSLHEGTFLLSLHAHDTQLFAAKSRTRVETLECLRLPPSLAARVTLGDTSFFLDPGFGGAAGAPLSLTYTPSCATFLAPGQPLATLTLVPVASPSSPSSTLYTPPAEEAAQNG